MRVHAGDQRGQLRSRHVVADADGQSLAGAGKGRQRAIVDRQEFPGMSEEGGTARRQLHVPGCALQKPAAQPVFQAFQFQADSCLRGLHDFRGAREAAQLGDANEGLNGVEIQRAISHDKRLLLR
ncbi:hypothetical protein D9M72_577920 [compost metagenome]